MKPWTTSVLIFLSLTSGSACGGSSDSGDGDSDSPDGNGTGGGSNGTGGDSSASGGSGTGGGTISEDAWEADFYVDVFKFHFSGGQYIRPSSRVQNPPPDECGVQAVGACTLRTCPLDSPDVDNQYIDAGEVTASFEVEGGPIVASSLPGQDGTYPTANFSPAGVLLSGDEEGTISAAGNDVGAFSQDVRFPLVLLNTSPTPTLVGSAYEIVASRSTDLSLSWDRGVAGVYYWIQAATAIESDTQRFSLNCTLPSEAGTGTIPQSLLTQLPVDSTLITLTVRHHSLDVGEHEVHLRLVTDTTVEARDGLVRIRLVD